MRRRFLVLGFTLVVLVAAGVVALTGNDATVGSRGVEASTGPAGGAANTERRELAGATAVVVDHEVWVFGGVSGPDGSSPPSTSWAPPGWTANDLAIVYDAEGSERRRVALDEIAGHTLIGGRVIPVGDDRYLLGNLCGGVAVLGCSETVDPLLVRFDGSETTRMELRLPPADVTTDLGDGWLHVIGQTDDGLVWATQTVADQTELPVSQTRLLAIDATTGVGTQVDLPEGLINQGTVCLSATEIFATQATLNGSALTSLRIVRRPATTATAEWQSFVEPDVDLGQVSGGTLECLPGDELALLVRAYPHAYVLTYSTSTGEPAGERLDLTPNSGHVVARLGTRTVLGSLTDENVLDLLVHEVGGTWEPSGVEASRDAVPIVLDGELRDARQAVASTRPDRVEFPLVGL